MQPYPKFATTVIGAYSVPDWFEALDRLVAVGQLSLGAIADAQFRASQAGPPGISPRAVGNELILVVEDDAALRAYTVQILGELGYGVMEAADGQAGLALLKERADIDLLFTDIVMPGGLNGRELADQAAKLRPGLKVLFTTGAIRATPSSTTAGSIRACNSSASRFRSTSWPRRSGRCWTGSLSPERFAHGAAGHRDRRSLS